MKASALRLGASREQQPDGARMNSDPSLAFFGLCKNPELKPESEYLCFIPCVVLYAASQQESNRSGVQYFR